MTINIIGHWPKRSLVMYQILGDGNHDGAAHWFETITGIGHPNPALIQDEGYCLKHQSGCT